ncbi:MAG: hypothetical protein GYB33_11175 [Gammaproteobacteria bacterium]|nr:hypothetical protein [Gammaproteobacteria bacterium]
MEFTGFEKQTIEAIGDCRGAVKNCGKNAIYHLEKAWQISEIDFEMAIFRAITAEEEAASSLFYCLKNNNYINSGRSSFKEHAHKLGLFPFVQGVGRFLGDVLQQDSSPFDKFNLRHINKDGRKAIELLLNLRSQNITVTPLPPLHFTVSNSDTKDVLTFENNFKELINGLGYENSIKYIKSIANTRNEILYANSAGKPNVSGDIPGYINLQKKKVMLFLRVVLMIDPWEKSEGKSLFVQQCLDSYLLLLERITINDINRS